MRRSVRWFSVLIATLLLPVSTAGLEQTPAPAARGAAEFEASTGNSLVLGRVVDAGSGQPVTGAIVTLGGNQTVLGNPAAAELIAAGVLPGSMAPSGMAMTDTRGAFIFRDVAAGRANLTVRAPGYLPGGYGQRRPEGSTRSLRINDGETLADVEIRVWKAGAVSGTVYDELGEPVVQVPLRALRRSIVLGRVKLVPAAFGSTDDRGMYRIGSLPPGEYLIVMPTNILSIPVAVADAYLSAASATDPVSRAMATDVNRAGTAAASGGVTVGDQRIHTDYSRALAPSPRTPDEFAVYPIVFHPSARAPDQAAVVTVGSGEELSGIDLRTGLVRTYRISGTVTGPDGPMPHVNVRLVPAFTEVLSSDSGFVASTTSTDTQGRFTILGATPGDYVVRAQRMGATGSSATVVRAGDGTFMVLGGETGPPNATGPGMETLTGESPVSVADAHVNDVAVTLSSGARIAGRLEFTGPAPRPGPADLSRVAPSVTRTDGMSVPAQQTRASPDGTFSSPAYPLGEYMIHASPPPGWHLRSVLVDGRETLNRAVDVSGDLDGVVFRFADRLPELSGRIARAGSSESVAAAVAIFPADYQDWIASGMSPRRARLVDAGADGTFEIPTIVPGEYLLAAIPADTPVELQDPRDIETLARVATRVSVSDTDQSTLTLSIARIR